MRGRAAADGKTYHTKCYNPVVIISVGYRVKSARGTSFRQWATKVLREYLVQGYVLNEKRLQESARQLAALTLLIAESKPEDKNTMATLVVNLINDTN